MSKQSTWLRTDDAGRTRCWWCGDDPLYIAYHDEEWGRPVHDDHRLFEKLCLEGFQSGLAWITILRKRDRFREVFHGFDFERVARMGARDVRRLLGDASIIRHRGKIESTINNAKRVCEIADEHGSLDAFLRTQVGEDKQRGGRTPRRGDAIPAKTDASTRLAKTLKQRGLTYVGPTTVYAFMQAMGMVNDHLDGCWVRPAVERCRLGDLRKTGKGRPRVQGT